MLSMTFIKGMKGIRNRHIVRFHFKNKTDLDFKETEKVIKDS